MMKWTKLNFGKYKGKTLPQVLFLDPDWFFWAVEERAFVGRKELHDQAMLLKDRATRVRVPSRFGPDAVAEYWVHPTVMKFAGVKIVPKARPAHQGGSPTLRSPVLDFSAPRRIASYDKTGGKLLVRNLKRILFENVKVRMTRKRAEGFFSDPSNFRPTK